MAPLIGCCPADTEYGLLKRCPIRPDCRAMLVKQGLHRSMQKVLADVEGCIGCSIVGLAARPCQAGDAGESHMTGNWHAVCRASETGCAVQLRCQDGAHVRSSLIGKEGILHSQCDVDTVDGVTGHLSAWLPGYVTAVLLQYAALEHSHVMGRRKHASPTRSLRDIPAEPRSRAAGRWCGPAADASQQHHC